MLQMSLAGPENICTWNSIELILTARNMTGTGVIIIMGTFESRHKRGISR